MQIYKAPVQDMMFCLEAHGFEAVRQLSETYGFFDDETVTALLSALEDSDTRVQARAHQALIILTGAGEVERNRAAWERHLKAHP